MGKERTQRAIDHWIETKDNFLLIDEMPYLEDLWCECAEEEDDYRSGVETYGYANDDGIKCTMEYISDRWMCAFRIKWILDGLANGRI